MDTNQRIKSPRARVAAWMAAGTLLVCQAVWAQEDMQILTRGPVHEAFAEAVSFEAEAGLIVTTSPPELIEELPPEQQPDGDNVAWIPGYWAWDDDQNDFIWISGIWRNLPPDREWVPGYWNELAGGRYQWTSGYWADTGAEEVEYVSAVPPRSIESGPNVPAPSADHNWVPGHWYWSSTRYVWRPGYWVPLRTNWTWVPSRYCWTPRGYVYVDGYWDYAVARRGVLFAPVSFHRHVYTRPGYYYTPSIVVALNVFSSHLFVRPACRHYYFGDYYAPRYRDSGFYASFTWHSHRHGYDPIHAYDRWHHRGDRDWERRRMDDYRYFRDHEEARPAHTWAAMREFRGARFNDGRNRMYARPLNDFARDGGSGQRFRSMDESRRKQLVSQRQEVRKFGDQRRQIESRAKGAKDTSGNTVAREKINRSPIKGREAVKFAKKDTPPERPQSRGERSVIASKDKAQKDGIGKGGPNADRPDQRKDGKGATSRDEAARDQGKGAAPGQNRDGKPAKGGSGGNVKRQDGGPANERKDERGAASRDDAARAQGKGVAPGDHRETKPEKAGKPSGPADIKKEADRPKKPIERVQPKSTVQPKADLRKPGTSKRESAPKAPAVRPSGQNNKQSPQRDSRTQAKVRQETKPQATAPRSGRTGGKGTKDSVEEDRGKNGKKSKD